MQHQTDRLVNVQELAEYLKVPRSWVYARTRQGEIPMLKAGKYCRFKIRDVEQWLQSKTNAQAA